MDMSSLGYITYVSENLSNISLNMKTPNILKLRQYDKESDNRLSKSSVNSKLFCDFDNVH